MSSMSGAAGNLSALAGPEAPAIVASLQSDANAMALLHESNLGEIQAGQRAVREASDSAVRAYAQRMITEHTALDAQMMQLGQRLNVAPALPDSTLPQLQQRELQALPSGSGAATGGMTGGAMRTDSVAGQPSTTPSSGSALVGTARDSTIPGGTSPASSRFPGTDSTRAAGGTAGTTGTTGAMAGHAGHTMGATAGSATAFDRAYIAHQVMAHARTLQLVDAAAQRTQQAELRTLLETQARPKVQEHLQQAQQIQQRIGSP
jgi:predicted outer membrane protein